MVKILAPILKTTRNPPDYVHDYQDDYGCLGPFLQAAVVKARTQSPPASTTTNTLTSVVNTYTRTVNPPTGIVQQVQQVLQFFSFLFFYSLPCSVGALLPIFPVHSISSFKFSALMMSSHHIDWIRLKVKSGVKFVPHSLSHFIIQTTWVSKTNAFPFCIQMRNNKFQQQD